MVQSTPFKYWETRGIKDVTSYTGGDGIDRWALTKEDYEEGRWSGADWACRRVTGVTTIRRPANPTSINGTKVTVRNTTGSPITIQPGHTSSQLTLDRSNSYDCTTWENYTVCTYDYQAVKSKAGTPQTETKKFLVARPRAAAQNLAFDLDDYDYDWEA